MEIFVFILDAFIFILTQLSFIHFISVIVSPHSVAQFVLLTILYQLGQGVIFVCFLINSLGPRDLVFKVTFLKSFLKWALTYVDLEFAFGKEVSRPALWFYWRLHLSLIL